jgi:amino acid transporter
MVNVGTLFGFLLVSGGVIILRRTRPDLPRAFRAPLVPLLPIASVCACVWLIVNLTVVTLSCFTKMPSVSRHGTQMALLSNPKV